MKDLEVNNYLFQEIGRNIMETILNRDNAKHIWDLMKLKYQGLTRVKQAQLQSLQRDFEIFHMSEGKGIDTYFACTIIIANKMKTHGERMNEIITNKKILRSMTSKYDTVVCSIKESKNLDTLTIYELQSNLIVHEQRMNAHVEEE